MQVCWCRIIRASSLEICAGWSIAVCDRLDGYKKPFPWAFVPRLIVIPAARLVVVVLVVVMVVMLME